MKIPWLIKLPEIVEGAELCYDMGHDRIGDALGALAIMRHVWENWPVRISILYRAFDVYDHGWSRGIKLKDWLTWKPFAVYEYESEVPAAAIFFNSINNMPVWGVLKDLKVYPELREPDYVKERYASFVLPEKYVAMHVLQAVGMRNIGYVQRRALDAGKYREIAVRLHERLKVETIRLGAVYDSNFQFDEPVIDFTGVTMPLEFSFHVLAGAKMFIGGDTGLKLAAAALGVPVVIEVDDESVKLGGLNGTRPDLLTLVPYGCGIEEHMEAIRGKL